MVLIETTASPDVNESIRQWAFQKTAPLHVAECPGQKEVFNGASVNDVGDCRDGKARTPLAAAVESRHVALVVHLLSLGADTAAADVMNTAMLVSTPEVVRALIDAGGCVNAVKGKQPPVFAAITPPDRFLAPAMVRLLLAEPTPWQDH